MATGIDKLASELQRIIDEKDRKKKRPYDTEATVTRVEGDIAWVKIPGGVDETPAQRTIGARPGDSVQLRVSGGRAYLIGNGTSPPTDDRVAYTAMDHADVANENASAAGMAANEALDNANIAAEKAAEATNNAAEAKEAAEQAKTQATAATTAANEAKTQATAATTAANEAKDQATAATAAANEAKTQATAATTAAGEAKAAANEAKSEASIAHGAANDALAELSTVEDVVGVVTWAAEHSEQDMADYINSHLALTTYGLDLVLDNTSYRIHIGTHTAGGEDGVYVIDDEGHVVSFFGEDIRFDSGHAQYIGNPNAYIAFDPTGNGGQGSLIIGGSSIQMGSRTLDEVLGNTLIYDHTYEYVRDSNNKPVSANFTAFLYRGGIDVKTEYPAENFTWYLKKEEKGTGEVTETLIGTGYTCSVDLDDCGYGAEVVGKFSIMDEANALSTDGDNLTDVDGENLSVRATGESVRVRDLSTSTTIFPTDKLMVVGAEDEHLVTMQTLQDYLNVHLKKQVLFNTTAAWNAQVQLTSEPDTLYIYTDHQTDSQGNKIAGIKVGDGNAYLIDMPFTDEVIMDHIDDNVRHITAEERAFWNNKVSCYLADGDRVIFTTA